MAQHFGDEDVPVDRVVSFSQVEEGEVVRATLLTRPRFLSYDAFGLFNGDNEPVELYLRATPRAEAGLGVVDYVLILVHNRLQPTHDA